MANNFFFVVIYFVNYKKNFLDKVRNMQMAQQKNKLFNAQKQPFSPFHQMHKFLFEYMF